MLITKKEHLLTLQTNVTQSLEIQIHSLLCKITYRYALTRSQSQIMKKA